MKKVLVFISALIFAGAQAWSQGTSVTVYSAKGEKFTLQVNGVTQNSKPETRVSAGHVGGPMVKVKVFLEETAIPPITKSVMNKPNAEFFFVLQKNEKGKYILQATSDDLSDQKKDEKETADTGESKAGNDNSVKETKTTTETTEKTKTETTGTEKTSRCDTPMADGDFYASLGAMSHQPFEPGKISSAKNLVKKHCLTASHIREVINIFSYEKSKLDFAKFAYDFVYDPANYEEVNDALRPGSVNELKRYIDTKK